MPPDMSDIEGGVDLCLLSGAILKLVKCHATFRFGDWEMEREERGQQGKRRGEEDGIVAGR